MQCFKKALINEAIQKSQIAINGNVQFLFFFHLFWLEI